MQKFILKKLLTEHPELFTILEVESIMDEELNNNENMDTGLVDCCLKALDRLQLRDLCLSTEIRCTN